jgi:hypothetical protein
MPQFEDRWLDSRPYSLISRVISALCTTVVSAPDGVKMRNPLDRELLQPPHITHRFVFDRDSYAGRPEESVRGSDNALLRFTSAARSKYSPCEHSNSTRAGGTYNWFDTDLAGEVRAGAAIRSRGLRS